MWLSEYRFPAGLKGETFMLGNPEKSKSEDKAKLNREIKDLRARLVAQQQQVRAGKLPVLVLIEGWSAAGKGSLIKEIISEMDPRFYQVSSPAVIPESESRYPFLYPLPWVVVALTYIVMMRKPIRRLQQRYRKTVIVASIGVCIAGLALTIWEMTCEHEWAKLNRGVERHYTAAVIDRYDKLSNHYHNNPRFLYSYMYAQYKVSRLDEAVSTYQQLHQYADTYDMELLAGDTYRHLQQHNEALQHYETAMWMCPVRFAPLEGMMQTYRDNGDIFRADSIAQVILEKPVKIPSPQVEEIKRKAKEAVQGSGVKSSKL